MKMNFEISMLMLIFTWLMFFFPVKLTAAPCYNIPCPTPTPCPTVSAGTNIQDTKIYHISDPDTEISNWTVYQCCKNPTNVNTAEEWADYLGICATAGTDEDIRTDFKWYHQEPPECECEEVWNSPSNKGDPVYKVWSGTVDLTEPNPPEPYELECKWYNVQQSSNGCPINFVEEKTKTCTITVIYVPPYVDPLPNLPEDGRAPYEWVDEDCKVEWREGTGYKTWKWEKCGGPFGSGCGQSISGEIQYEINLGTTVGVEVGILDWIRAHVTGSLETTESILASAPCDAINCKRRQLTFWQRPCDCKFTFQWGYVDIIEGVCQHFTSEGWKALYETVYEDGFLQANCAEYVMDTPTY